MGSVIPSLKISQASFNIDFAGSFRELEKRATPLVKAMLTRAAADARANLERNKSVDSGLLKKSIKTKFKTRGRIFWGAVGVDSNVDGLVGKATKRTRRPIKYAHLIERGFTHYPDGGAIKVKPFLAPAINKMGGADGIAKKLKDISIEIMAKAKTK